MEVLTTDEALKTLKGSSARPFHSDVLDTEEAIKILRAHSQVEKREPKVYTVSKPQEPRTYHRNADGLMTQVVTQPTVKQQKQAENAARLDALAGRTGAQKDLSAPLSKPQAIRDFTTGDIVQTVVPKAQSEKQSGGLLAGIQNLMEAANPVAKGVDMLRYLQNQEQAKAQADGIADQRIMELREQAKTNPAVLHSDEYIKAMSRPVSLFSGMVRDIPQIDPEGKSSLDRIAPVMQSKRAEAQNELLEGKTGLGKMGTQALISGADMLGSAGLAGMTGVPFLGVMAGQSGADAGQRALDEGHSYDKAALFAAGTGGITAGIESFGGVAGKWGDDAARALAKTKIGQAVLSKVPAAVGKKLSDLASSKLGKIATDALSEGSEEFAEYYAQNFFENLMLDKNTPYDVREALANAAVGSMVGGIFGGGRVAADLFAGRNTNAQAAQPAQESAFTRQAGTDANAVQSAAQTDSAGHTPEMQRTIAEYQAAVDPGIAAFVKKIMGMRNRNATSKLNLPLSEVGQDAASKINRLTGVNVAGYRHNMNGSAVNHIAERHGQAGKSDTSMANIEDIARIQYVLDRYDSLAPVLTPEGNPDVTYAYHNSDGSPAKLVKYGKRIDGTYYVVEAAPDTASKKLQIISAYIQKTEGTPQAVDAKAPHPYVRNAHASVPSINPTLPQQADGVNTSIPGSGVENDMLGEISDLREPDYLSLLNGKGGLLQNEYSKKFNRRTRRALDAAGKKLGVAIVFDAQMDGDGYYDGKNRIIHISMESTDPLNVVMTHEMTHRMKETSPELYQEFSQLAAQAMQNARTYGRVGAAVEMTYGTPDADEVTAHYTRMLVSDISEFEKLVGVNRNLAQKMLDLLDEVFHKLGFDSLGDPQASAEVSQWFGDISRKDLENTRRVWREMLQKADAGAETQDGIRRHVALNAEADIDRVLNGERLRTQVRLRDYTPAALVDRGIPDLPMYMNAAHIRENILSEAEARAQGLPIRKEIHYHGLGKNLFLKAVDAMDGPVEVFQWKKNPYNNYGPNDYLVITQVADQGGNRVIVPIVINSTANANNAYIDVNEIKSIYGRRSLDEYLARYTGNQSLSRIKRKKSQSANVGVQFAEIPQSGASSITEATQQDQLLITSATSADPRLPQMEPGVNPHSMQEGRKYSRPLVLETIGEKAKRRGDSPDEYPFKGIAENHSTVWGMNNYSYRCTNEPQVSSSYAGYGMFADNPSEAMMYGKDMYAVRHSDLVDIDDLKPRLIEIWKQAKEDGYIPPEFRVYEDASDEYIGEMFDPLEIVDGAEAWDIPELISWFYDFGAFDDIKGIKTRDGAIVFAEYQDIAKKINKDSEILAEELENPRLEKIETEEPLLPPEPQKSLNPGYIAYMDEMAQKYGAENMWHEMDDREFGRAEWWEMHRYDPIKESRSLLSNIRAIEEGTADADLLKKYGLDDLRPKQATAGMLEDIADLRPGKQDGRLYAVAPELREAVTGESMLDRLKSSVKPHESLTGSRLADESSIKHLGEADAFDNVKVLLEEAMDERAERKKNAEEPVAQILDSGAKKENVNLLDKLGDAKLKLVDSGAQIDKIGKALGDDVLYPLYNNAKQARQAAMYHIGKAQTDLQGRKIGKSVMEIFEPIKVQGNDYFKAFEEYLFHRHNVDSMTMKTRGAAVLQGFLDQVEAQHPELAGKSAAEVRRMRRDPAMREAANEWLALKRRQNGLKDKPVFGYSVTAEDSMGKADALQMEHPEFEQLSQDVYAYYRNQLQNEADAGLISAKERELLNQLYPHYVPVITEEMGVKPTQNGRFAGVADVHKSREGNVRNLIPIDEAMARNTLSSVAAAKRNLFGVRLLEGALSERGKVGRDVQSVYDADIPYGTDDVPRLDNEFMVWVDGSPTVMRVSNPLMEGVNSMMPKQVNKNELLELMRKGNTAFKIGVTSANPAFLVRNGIRDIQDAVTYTKDLKSFVKNYPKAYQEIMQDGEMWQLYQSMGGTGDSFFDYEKGLLNNEPKNPAGKFIAKMQSLNEMVEQAPRLAEFMSTIQKGGTGYENVQRALLDAADVTVNFGRSGELTKALNSTVVPFLNPSVQGTSKFIRNLSQGNVKAWVRTIAKMSLAGLLPSLINELVLGDDEEYQMLSDSVKDNYFLFPIGDGRFFRLPKGRAGMPVGNLATRAVRAARGQEPDMLSYLQSTVDSTAPQNPFKNNLLAALNDSQLFDSDSPGRTWYGGQIEPERLRSLEPGDRTDENTDAFSTMAGKAMGISPKKINYLLDQYTGFAGDMLLPLMTPAARENLLVSNFVTDSVMSNRLADDFYSAKDQAQQAFNSRYNPLDKARYDALSDAAKDISEDYARIRDVNTSSLPKDEKLSQVREIRKGLNEKLKAAVAAADEAYERAQTEWEDIPDEVYYNAYIAQKGAKGDKDRDGKTIALSASKNKKRAIDAAAKDLTTAQKRKLYEAFGVSEKVW